MVENEANVSIRVSFGTTDHFFERSLENIRSELLAVFPESEVELNRNFTIPSETVIHVLISFTTVSSSIIVGEMLKELAKDLWTAIRKSILPIEMQSDQSSDGAGDELQVELQIGEFYATIKRRHLNKGSEEELSKFLMTELDLLYSHYLTSLKKVYNQTDEETSED